MRYPVIIHKDPTSDYGVTVPDFPGAFSGGASLEEALANVQEAVALLREGTSAPAPAPSSLEAALASPDAAGGAVVFIDLDVALAKGRAVRVNVTMPAPLRDRIDTAARAAGLSRSGFLARAAQAALTRA